MKSPSLTITPLVAVIAWIVALIVDPGDLRSVSVLLIGLSLLSMATVAVVGMVLSGGRWTWRLAQVVGAASLVVAAIRPIDAFWYVALGLSAASIAAMFLPGVTDRIRKRPSASGPPSRSVLTPLMLLAVPFLIGVTAVKGRPWAMIAVGFTSLLSAFLYARVIPGGLLAVRIVWPVVAVGLAPFLGVAGGTVSALLGVTVAILAWHPSVKVAFYPPVETGSAYPIPPELTPQEILDAAQIDDRGKRQ